MYLIDTDVISELRKDSRANKGVLEFFAGASRLEHALYVSVVTIGELRRGLELMRHRKDLRQASRLEKWLDAVLEQYSEHLLEFGYEEAQVWGKLRVPHPENAIDKQIAATALTHGLTLVTHNARHFSGLGIEVVDPFL